ncbi:hypothetical protein BJ742DRAFT_854190 [Cladochytrium replicatum]|nr:hypothetical protein BJ742DRAFT_854190 [Cladochytrium replicatum]
MDRNEHLGYQGGTYKNALTWLDMMGMGIGTIIGAVVCVFAAFNYAEIASMIPISGSAYTYTYATLGEFVAWVIGWDVMLEYIVGAAEVAVGRADYVEYFLHEASGGSINFDKNWSNSPVIWNEDTQAFEVIGA